MAALPQFRIDWRDVVGISKDVITGMTEEEAKQTLKSDRPMLVYVYDDSDEEIDNRVVVEEDKAFFDDRVLIGARFFDCVRIDAESAKEDRALAKKVGRLPALVFVRPNYEVAKVLPGKFNAKRIFATMTSVIKKDYENCTTCVYKAQTKLARERAKLGSEWAKLDKLNLKIADEDNTSKRAQLQRERDELEKRLNDLQAEFNAREAKLYELKRKEKKEKS